MNPWEILDTQALLAFQRQQHEATTSANVGAYPVPLGAPLRPPMVIPPEQFTMGMSPVWSGEPVLPQYQTIDQVLSDYARSHK